MSGLRDLYIQTGLQHVKEKINGENAGYATGEITFYHVSAKKKYVPDVDKPMLPRRTFKMKVLLKYKFAFAYES